MNNNRITGASGRISKRRWGRSSIRSTRQVGGHGLRTAASMATGFATTTISRWRTSGDDDEEYTEGMTALTLTLQIEGEVDRHVTIDIDKCHPLTVTARVMNGQGDQVPTAMPHPHLWQTCIMPALENLFARGGIIKA